MCGELHIPARFFWQQAPVERTRYRRIHNLWRGKCTPMIKRHSLCSDGLSRHGGVGSAYKDTTSGFQAHLTQKLSDSITDHM